MIKSNRNVYVAGHVTPQVKEAMKKACDDLKKSQSQFISDAIVDALEDCGQPIGPPPKDDRDVPLPLED